MSSVRKIDNDIRHAGNLEVKWDGEDGNQLKIRMGDFEKLKWFDTF